MGAFARPSRGGRAGGPGAPSHSAWPARAAASRPQPRQTDAPPPPPPPAHPTKQGALFGFLLYGTVDLTNCALLLNWGWRVALIDMAWGSLACSVLALTQRSLCSAMPALGIN